MRNICVGETYETLHLHLQPFRVRIPAQLLRAIGNLRSWKKGYSLVAEDILLQSDDPRSSYWLLQVKTCSLETRALSVALFLDYSSQKPCASYAGQWILVVAVQKKQCFQPLFEGSPLDLPLQIYLCLLRVMKDNIVGLREK